MELFQGRKVKLGLLGASGRMGSEVTAILSNGFELDGFHFELADVVCRSKKIRSIEGIETRTLSEPAREPVHVWVDFSTPEATLELLKLAMGPIVIGTTGFSNVEIEKIQAYANHYPVLMSSNTSPGMNLMMELLKNFPCGSDTRFDVVLSEEHHSQKKDSPSGTANTLLAILKEKGYVRPQVCVTRAGRIKGVHSIRFVSQDEEIEIRHEVYDRSVFARGALMGALFLVQLRKAGMHTMADVFRETTKGGAHE